MLNRFHRVRIPLHQLVQPPPPNCQICSTAYCGSYKGKEREKVPASHSNHSNRSIDWSKPSTSAIPYSPSLSTQHRPYSTSPAPSISLCKPSSETTPSLEDLLSDTAPRASISTLLRSFAHHLPTLSRSTFDRLFDRLSDTNAITSAQLRQIRSVVEKEKDWKLKERQLRIVLRATVQREKEHRLKQISIERVQVRFKEKGKAKEEDSERETTKEEERAIWAQRKRQNVSDALFKEYVELVTQQRRPNKRDHGAIEEVLELFATCASLRPVSTTRDQDGQAMLAFSLALDYSKCSEEPMVIENDIAEVIRRMFGNGRGEEAISILKKMADKRRILTVKVMREIVRDHYEEQDGALSALKDQARPIDTNLLAQFDENPSLRPSTTSRFITPADEYSHARQVLDQVCSSTSTAGLDELLRLRLERVDRLEELEKNPRGAFLKWLSIRGVDKPEWIEVALKVWEAGVEKGENGEALVGRTYRKVLEGLVLKACQNGKLSEGRPGDAVLEPSPLIDYAVNLALDHFPLQVLIHHSHALLHALTVDSHSPELACFLFDTVNSPPIDFAFAPFQWSATLLTPFTRLFFSSRRYEKDPSLPVRLYLSWTSSGLTFPAGLWDPFWRSLGQTGNIDDLERVLQDWEETGRGPGASRIVRQVLQGAINSGNIPRSLELFKFFRSRYTPTSFESDPQPVPAFQRTHLHPLVVPVESYNSLFTLLAHSGTDHRKILSTLFSSLIFDGHSPSTEIYNALLASNLLRTKFKVSDIDSAGVIYNKMVQSGLKPDRGTFGLLMHGFNRMATEGEGGRLSKQRVIGIEASLRTFKASLASLDSRSTDEARKKRKNDQKSREEVQTLAKGASVASLMKILAQERRFEEAKEVGEEWWRALIKLEDIVGSRGFWEGRQTKDESAEMRKAAVEVERLERMALGEKGGEASEA